MSLKTALTAARIYQLFDVDLGKGILKRKRSVGLNKAGEHAGYVTKSGYRIIRIDRVNYFEHNLIWFLVHGEWPQPGYELDHKNRKRGDNRPSNLRLCTRSQNCANATLRKDNRAGYRGVHFDAEKRKYAVQVTKNKKCYNLGYFTDLKEAAEVAAKFRSEIWGDFAHNPNLGQS